MNKYDIWIWNTIDKYFNYWPDHIKYLLYRYTLFTNHVNETSVERSFCKGLLLLKKRGYKISTEIIVNLWE